MFFFVTEAMLIIFGKVGRLMHPTGDGMSRLLSFVNTVSAVRVRKGSYQLGYVCRKNVEGTTECHAV